MPQLKMPTSDVGVAPEEIVSFGKRRREDCGSDPQQGDVAPSAPVRKQRDRPEQDGQAPRGDTSPNE